MSKGPDLTTFLWFANEASIAAHWYVSIFPNSRITAETRSPVQTTIAAGEILTCNFELNGRPFTALNGNPSFPFTKAISFVVVCDTQDEIDYYWTRLTAEGGQEVQCGWLTDRFGVSWQITPRHMGKLIATPAGMHAMMRMNKIDIAALEELQAK